LNATAISGFLKYPGLVVEKPGFRVVENSQKKRVSGSGKPGLETLLADPQLEEGQPGNSPPKFSQTLCIC